MTDREDYTYICCRLSPPERVIILALGYHPPPSVAQAWARADAINATAPAEMIENNGQRRRREAKEWAAQAYVGKAPGNAKRRVEAVKKKAKAVTKRWNAQRRQRLAKRRAA